MKSLILIWHVNDVNKTLLNLLKYLQNTYTGTRSWWCILIYFVMLCHMQDIHIYSLTTIKFEFENLLFVKYT